MFALIIFSAIFAGENLNRHNLTVSAANIFATLALLGYVFTLHAVTYMQSVDQPVNNFEKQAQGMTAERQNDATTVLV